MMSAHPRENRLALPPGLRWALPFFGAAPSLTALFVTVLGFLVIAVGGHSRWLDTDMTPAEAALTGDVGRLYRLLQQGQSAMATYRVRDKYLKGEKASMLTPVEASIAGGNRAVIILLFGHDGTTGNAIRCEARKQNKHDIETLLKNYGATPTDLTCP